MSDCALPYGMDSNAVKDLEIHVTSDCSRWLRVLLISVT